MRRPRRMQVMIEFGIPSDTPFPEVRDFIIDALELWGDPDQRLDRVKVSKPIALWRPPDE